MQIDDISNLSQSIQMAENPAQLQAILHQATSNVATWLQNTNLPPDVRQSLILAQNALSKAEDDPTQVNTALTNLNQAYVQARDNRVELMQQIENVENEVENGETPQAGSDLITLLERTDIPADLKDHLQKAQNSLGMNPDFSSNIQIAEDIAEGGEL